MTHWSKRKEGGGLLGLKTTLFLYKTLGRTLTYFVMYIVIIYYFLVKRSARNASFGYIKRIHNLSGLKLWLYSYKHFASFGEMLIDKLAVWNKSITAKNIYTSQETSDRTVKVIQSKKGGIIFTAHFGNLEVARALSTRHKGMKINALVFSENAIKLNNMLTKINPDHEIGMVSLETVTPKLAIELSDKIDNGEFIVITGDRTSTTNNNRNIKINFLEDEALIPQGPFILANLLKCPAFFMVCPKISHNQFEFILDDFDSQGINLNRTNREQSMEKYANRYTLLLEKYCLKYPKQWFNFFDFWNKEDSK